MNSLNEVPLNERFSNRCLSEVFTFFPISEHTFNNTAIKKKHVCEVEGLGNKKNGRRTLPQVRVSGKKWIFIVIFAIPMALNSSSLHNLVNHLTITF